MTNSSKDTNHLEDGNSGDDSNDLQRPDRDDGPFEVNVFPDTELGQLLDGITMSFLIKQEPRRGWYRKKACSEIVLSKHPCEVVAAHQWGVGWLIMCLIPSRLFRQEAFPNFDASVALQMALIHDQAESITSDITPVDGISADEKHRRESKAMNLILARFPDEIAERLRKIYLRYEERKCSESKLVKDCDRLDFMITAFMLERQGFKGLREFYINSNKDFHTKFAQDLANLLIETRDRLAATDKLYPKSGGLQLAHS